MRLETESEVMRQLLEIEGFPTDQIPDFEAFGDYNNNGSRTNVLIMEYVRGTNLKTFISTQRKKLGEEEILSIIREICGPLEKMADADPVIFHRDIKPSNIILPERGGKAVLIDFGLSKHVDTGHSKSKSKGGMTPFWSPLERAESTSGHFTDVFGVGRIMHYLFRPDLDRGNKDTGHERILADMKANNYPSSSIPTRFCIEAAHVIAKATMRDYKKRTSSMAAFVDQIIDLERIIEES